MEQLKIQKVLNDRRDKTEAKKRLAAIPKGTASDDIIQGCLVLEGGAFRGLYTEGFIDNLMLHGINLSCTIGVSAGALSGLNYVSGQIGRSARTNIGFRHDSRYVGAKAFMHSGSIVNVGFLTQNQSKGPFEPFNAKRFWETELRFVVVATNAETGKAEYFEKSRCGEFFDALRASATMPYISPAVVIEGTPYYDGGCACNIPYQWALDEGFKKIIVVKTRDARFRYPEKLEDRAYRMYKLRHPAFADVLAHTNYTCNAQYDEVEKLGEEGRIYVAAPSRPITIGRIESDLNKLSELYWHGYEDCEAQLPAIKQYLGL